ncbi:MAG TPA: amidohydrolase family protein [Rhizobacter sp.]|nr:amidohydrolase family protein [Rhizobacter sp.]
MQIIDAHQHFWRLADRAGQWPPASLVEIHRDFGPADLQPFLERCHVSGTVLVQSLPSVADTEYLLQLAERHAFVRGVVGWVDLKAADAAAQIDRLAQHRQLKGLRPMLQDLDDERWIDDPALEPAVAAMRGHRLSFDALVLPRHLGALLAFARRNPALPIVIDHAAKPAIPRGQLQPWLGDLAALAALPQVHCKLSGLLTEAGPFPHAQRLQPWMEAVYQLFGPRRLIWGSDWPVLNLAGHYEGWLAMALRFCELQPGASDETLAAIFGGNARRFYRLDGG